MVYKISPGVDDVFFNKNFNVKTWLLPEVDNKIIGYGSPARVSTITNFSKINSSLIDYIIDDSPIKQNKYTPGSHIKILPRKGNINNKIDIVVVFAYEYFKDIKNKFKKYKVTFFKPIPFKTLK